MHCGSPSALSACVVPFYVPGHVVARPRNDGDGGPRCPPEGNGLLDCLLGHSRRRQASPMTPKGSQKDHKRTPRDPKRPEGTPPRDPGFARAGRLSDLRDPQGTPRDPLGHPRDTLMDSHGTSKGPHGIPRDPQGNACGQCLPALKQKCLMLDFTSNKNV